MMSRPYGVHTIANIYSESALAGMPDGGWAQAVCLPYHGTLLERVRAAWWVLTGRAYALQWPEPGDLETVMRP